MSHLNSILKEPLPAIAFREAGKLNETRFEKLHTEVFANVEIGSVSVATEIASIIRSRQEKNEPCVLGLATGSSPIGVYKELIRLHQEEGLSFDNVVTFNLDEYYPMEKGSVNSYYYFMHEHLFDHVDIRPENINIPSGSEPIDNIYSYCSDYEAKIEACGGLDFQLLGIGRTGHIGFNEPGSHKKSYTRLVTLDYLTKADAASDFHGVENVPMRAITMGIRTIMQAKRVVLLAWGPKKASIVKQMIEEVITSQVPASYLQDHANTTVILDEQASKELKRFKTPWLVGPVEWPDTIRNKAVVWLSSHLGKTILKLTNEDYNENGMSDLIALEGSAYDLNIKVHNRLQYTISGWPGGKPNTDDSKRPERSEPVRKRAIIFSPHPDDDVISMGGTFLRLVEQGHDVHVVYQTSGNIAVSDDDALKFLEFSKKLAGKGQQFNETVDAIIDELRSKSERELDSVQLRRVKGFIRQLEATAAARYCGLQDSNIHFLNMPFYETGKVKKNPLSEEDLRLVQEIIERVKPHQIFAAGDLNDPNGTHKVCLNAIRNILKKLKGRTFMANCLVWLYRGAWHEWPIDEIEMAVPLSPDEVMKKRKAIFFHESQKDGVMFQGEDSREFWQRAEDRNAHTAHEYNALGLTEYQAIEAFKKLSFI